MSFPRIRSGLKFLHLQDSGASLQAHGWSPGFIDFKPALHPSIAPHIPCGDRRDSKSCRASSASRATRSLIARILFPVRLAYPDHWYAEFGPSMLNHRFPVGSCRTGLGQYWNPGSKSPCCLDPEQTCNRLPSKPYSPSYPPHPAAFQVRNFRSLSMANWYRDRFRG